MLDTLEPRSLVEAAEQAAAAGDYSSAERLLRKAARLQEAQLGPVHPDLANTLNNLGVVCEITEKPADAERCYRRAYSIAVARFEPNHPFVTTSGKNLRAFCEAQGKRVELPPPAVAPQAEVRDTSSAHAEAASSPTVPAEALGLQPKRATRALEATAPLLVQAPAAQSLTPGVARKVPLPAVEVQASPSGRAFRPFLIAVIAGGGLVLALLVVLIGGQAWAGRAARSGGLQPPRSSASPDALPNRSGTPPAVAPSATPQKPASPPERARVEPASPPKATTNAVTTGSRTAEESVGRGAAPVLGVAVAEICRRLTIPESSDSQAAWRCDRPELPVDPGQLYFYTRVKAATDTKVQHRWYRGDQVRRSVELQILASPTEGYRTYSRYTVDASSRGDWRVELRTKDGVLLHEERFEVR